MSKQTAPAIATGRLAILRSEIEALLGDPKHFAPTKKKDGGDLVIGNLKDYPEMQGYYLIRAHRHEVVAGLVAAIGDLDATHSADHAHHGDELPDENCEAFAQATAKLFPEIQRPYDEWQSADRILTALLHIEFDLPPGYDTFGFREDFEIVARRDNARGDKADPTDDLKKLKHISVIPLPRSLADLVGASGGVLPGFSMEIPIGLGGSRSILEAILGLGGIFGGPRRRSSTPPAPTKPGGESSGN